MATITVKNIPDDLYARLKEVAEANHRSINGEIIACIERAVSPRSLTVDEFLESARKLRELTAEYTVTDEELAVVKKLGRL